MYSFPSISFRPLPATAHPKRHATQAASKPAGDGFFSGKSPSPTRQLETLLDLANRPNDPLKLEDVREATFQLLAEGANLEHQKNGKSLLEHLESLKLYSDEAREHAQAAYNSEAQICSYAGTRYVPEFNMQVFAPQFKPDTPAFDADDLAILRSWKGNFNKSAQWKPSHQNNPYHERTPLLQRNSLD